MAIDAQQLYFYFGLKVIGCLKRWYFVMGNIKILPKLGVTKLGCTLKSTEWYPAKKLGLLMSMVIMWSFIWMAQLFKSHRGLQLF